MGDLGIGLLVLGWVNDLNTPVSETLSGYSAGLHVDRPGSREKREQEEREQEEEMQQQ